MTVPPMHTRLQLGALTFVLAAVVVGTSGGTTRGDVREGGIFRIAAGGSTTSTRRCPTRTTAGHPRRHVCTVDDVSGQAVSGRPSPRSGGRDGPLQDLRNGKTPHLHTASGFRFSDGTPVRASAFARATTTLAPGIESVGGAVHGATSWARRRSSPGKTRGAAGVTARGNTLVVRFTRAVVNFPAMTTMPFFCAVPPSLPSDPEGVGAFPSVGPGRRHRVPARRAADRPRGIASTAVRGRTTSRASTSTSEPPRRARSWTESNAARPTGGLFLRPSISSRGGTWRRSSASTSRGSSSGRASSSGS